MHQLLLLWFYISGSQLWWITNGLLLTLLPFLLQNPILLVCVVAISTFLVSSITSNIAPTTCYKHVVHQIRFCNFICCKFNCKYSHLAINVIVIIWSHDGLLFEICISGNLCFHSYFTLSHPSSFLLLFPQSTHISLPLFIFSYTVLSNYIMFWE